MTCGQKVEQHVRMLMIVLAEEEKEVERCGEQSQGTVTAAESWREQEGMGMPLLLVSRQ